MPYCSSKDCNPMAPLFVTVRLVRKSGTDKEVGRCPKCKNVYNLDIMTDGKVKEFRKGLSCPRCGAELKPVKTFHYECPKCGRHY